MNGSEADWDIGTDFYDDMLELNALIIPAADEPAADREEDAI